MRRKYLYGLLLIVLMAFLGGSTGIFAKIALKEISPFGFTFLRFIFAALFIVPFVVHKIPRKNFLRLFFLSLFAAGNVILFAFGIQRTTVTSSSIIYILSPIMALLFGYIFLRHKFNGLNIVGILLGFLGAAAIILLPVLYGGDYAVGGLAGNLLIVLAMISFTIYTVRSKSAQKIFSHETITAGFLFVTLVITGVMSFIHPQQIISEAMHLSPYAWLAVIFVGLAGTGLQYLLQQIIIKKNSYVDGSLFLYIQPIATVLLAVPILHEKITYLFVIGAIVTLVGVWLSSRKA